MLVLALVLWVAAQDAGARGSRAAGHGHLHADFDDYYDEEVIVSSSALTRQETHTHPRVRRSDEPPPRTLSQDEIREVKGVLKEMMAGRTLLELMTAPVTETMAKRLQTVVDIVTRSAAFTGLTRSSLRSRNSGETQFVDPTQFYENIIEEIIDNARRQGGKGVATVTSSQVASTHVTSTQVTYEGFVEEETWRPKFDNSTSATTGDVEPERQLKRTFGPLERVEYDSEPDVSKNPKSSSPEDLGDLGEGKKFKMADWLDFPQRRANDNETITSGDSGDDTTTPQESEKTTSAAENITSSEKTTTEKTTTEKTTTEDIATTTPTTTTLRTRRTRRKTTTTTTPKEVVDIETLVEIIANLTMDYELINITDLFNKTLLKYNVPKCIGEVTETPSTTSTTTEWPGLDLANATIVSKCFVCGLETPGIPRNAYCADAFAGDFLPLVPVDPRARGQIARYRKYCRYLDMSASERDPTPLRVRPLHGRLLRALDRPERRVHAASLQEPPARRDGTALREQEDGKARDGATGRRQRLHHQSDVVSRPALARHLALRALPRVRVHRQLVQYGGRAASDGAICGYSDSCMEVGSSLKT